jgi:hypothetical protein
VELKSGPFVLTLLDDQTYTSGSADNARTYDREYCFIQEYQPVSQYGLVCQGPEGETKSCILLAGGGATCVHQHSAIVLNGFCHVAVGDMICSLSMSTLELRWATKVDTVTCFGVYYSARHDCLLSHGELVVARVTLGGEIVWSACGKDILTGDFCVMDDEVEAIDFNNEIYRIDIVSGHCELVQDSTKRRI